MQTLTVQSLKDFQTQTRIIFASSTARQKRFWIALDGVLTVESCIFDHDSRRNREVEVYKGKDRQLAILAYNEG